MIANGHDLTNGIWYIDEHGNLHVACPKCYRYLDAEDAYMGVDSGMPWAPCPSFQGYAERTWKDNLESQIKRGRWVSSKPGQMPAFLVTRLY